MNLISIILFFSLGFAGKGPDKNLTFLAQKIDSQTVQFLPPTEHHFNLEAPSAAHRISEGKSEVAILDKKESRIIAKWAQKTKSCEIEAQLYLCDDKNTYCVPVKRKFSCDKLSSIQSEGETQKVATSNTDLIKSHKDLFFLNDIKAAQAKALAEKKILLIDFFGIWCPPCNYLDEQVFNQKKFQNFQKDYVFLKMDADDTISFELKSKFNVKGYPTIVIANAELEEINRIVGSRNPEGFYAEMTKALKYKGLSLADRIAKANSLKNPEFAFDLAEMHLAQAEYEKANHYFTLALKNGTWNELRKNQMLSAQIGLISDSKLKASAIESSLQAFPYGALAYDRILSLIELAEELKDESLKNRAFHAMLKNAEYLLKNPSVYKNSEITEPDLFIMIAEVYNHSKNQEKSKDNYYKAFQAYTQIMKAQKVDENKERSNNLNRVYALYKSGRVEEANLLYEKLQQSYPKEFTFFYNHASQLKDAGELDKALAKAEIAYQNSYGDNQLRAAYLLADLKIKAGKKKDAKNLVEETLKNYKLPEGLKVRSHRYIEKLKHLL